MVLEDIIVFLTKHFHIELSVRDRFFCVFFCYFCSFVVVTLHDAICALQMTFETLASDPLVGGLEMEQVKVITAEWKPDQRRLRGLRYTDKFLRQAEKAGILEFVHHPKTWQRNWAEWDKFTAETFGTPGYPYGYFATERGFGIYPPPPSSCMLGCVVLCWIDR